MAEVVAVIGKKTLYHDQFWFRTAILESIEEVTLSDLPLDADADLETLTIKLEV